MVRGAVPDVGEHLVDVDLRLDVDEIRGVAAAGSHTPDGTSTTPRGLRTGDGGPKPLAARTPRWMNGPTMGLDLYWIPLGAGERPGQRVVRFSGHVYEAIAALVDRRSRQRLFHAALVATSGDSTVFVEVAPVPDGNGRIDRGVVAEGAVGVSWLGRLRLFRYEVRRWTNGIIPDLSYAVASPVHITDVPALVRDVLDGLGGVPTPVWGRDAYGTGEMWNSNSVIAWALARCGLDEAAGVPPDNGRAPGWSSGIAAARPDHAI